DGRGAPGDGVRRGRGAWAGAPRPHRGARQGFGPDASPDLGGGRQRLHRDGLRTPGPREGPVLRALPVRAPEAADQDQEGGHPGQAEGVRQVAWRRTFPPSGRATTPAPRLARGRTARRGTSLTTW